MTARAPSWDPIRISLRRAQTLGPSRTECARETFLVRDVSLPAKQGCLGVFGLVWVARSACAFLALGATMIELSRSFVQIVLQPDRIGMPMQIAPCW